MKIKQLSFSMLKLTIEALNQWFGNKILVCIFHRIIHILFDMVLLLHNLDKIEQLYLLHVHSLHN